MTARSLSRPAPRLLTMGVAAVLALGVLGEGGATDVASAAPSTTDTTTAGAAAAQPGLRFTPASKTVEAYNYDGYVYVDSAIWMGAYGEGYEFVASRAKASDPVTLTKTVIRGGERTTTKAPAKIVDGFNGFKRGLTVQVVDPEGKVLVKKSRSLCLSGEERQRIEPTGSTEPVYPTWCGGSWFTKSMVSGVEQGWATKLDTYFELKTTRKNLRMTVSISDPVADFLGLPADRRSVTQKVRVVDECTIVNCAEVGEELLGSPDEGFSTLAEGEPSALEARRQALTADAHADHGDSTESTHRTNLFTLQDDARAHAGADHPALGQPGSTPSNKAPAKDTLPDLQSLPAWQIGIERDGRKNRLTFNANEWNAGPSPLVVEGFRKGAGEVMDAYQFFYKDGKEVGSTKTGTMKYHEAPEHDHWHFLDFASYELVRPNGTLVTTSGKQSWCLAPTDPVDLSVPGATYRPEATGLDSTCGERSALWLREVMPVGWGDTYNQTQTQAFDLRGVGNGTYKIKITVNPNGALHERTTSNNVSYRTVILGGTAGKRTVKVPPYEGVNTEAMDGGLG
jgi:hypothetical protein